MNQGLKKTIVSFHISAILYFMVAVLFLILFIVFLGQGDESTAIAFPMLLGVVLSIAVGIFLEFVISALKKQKYWAWIAGIVISIIFIPSAFIILGIVALIGLLDENTRKAFEKK
ncbi:hypothetical protein KKH43_04865 [Patescibacteria group bacterium]|nr:hypothetical protein [Patescibacteria group bacterium]